MFVSIPVRDKVTCDTCTLPHRPHDPGGCLGANAWCRKALRRFWHEQLRVNAVRATTERQHLPRAEQGVDSDGNLVWTLIILPTLKLTAGYEHL